MRRKRFDAGSAVVMGVAVSVFVHIAMTQPENAEEPALPRVVAPRAESASPPADAIVLFDGSDFSNWHHANGANVQWVLDEDDHAMTIKPGSGAIVSRQSFGAAQIHVEFATPAHAQGSGQGRGNSGVYVQGRYEVQVLDSFENETYPDGQCGAIYGQYPPLVNASRAPGEWQAYDIIFHPPTFDKDGNKTFGGSMTVLHNRVLIQDHVELKGPTVAAMSGDEPGLGPLYLQDHGNPVRYRNIWVRSLNQ